MNKPVRVRLSIPNLSKTVIYEFWYDYVKRKYGEKLKLYYMDTDSFIVQIKADNIYTDIAEDVKTRYDVSNYELDRQLPKGNNTKAIGLMKDDLGGKIMTKFVELRGKNDSHFTDDGSEDKKAKGSKILFMKKEFKF